VSLAFVESSQCCTNTNEASKHIRARFNDRPSFNYPALPKWIEERDRLNVLESLFQHTVQTKDCVTQTSHDNFVVIFHDKAKKY
jgi:hypothetical protein